MNMKKWICLLLVAVMLLPCASLAYAATPTVQWNMDTLAAGELTASLSGVENGKWAILAYYCDGSLDALSSAIVENQTAELTIPIEFVTSGSYTSVYLWDKETLEPQSDVLATLTPSGSSEPEAKEIWVSDNQVSNRASSVAYHTFEAQSGLYRMSFDLTLNENGDCAVLLGDANNGALVYGTSSAILLFTGNGYFATRNGGGSGSYSASAVNLCAAVVGETYRVVMEGDVQANTYTVSITDESGATYTSDTIHARMNAGTLDTIALISNSHNTTVNGDAYSNYKFHISDFFVEGVPLDVTYQGFAGRYYGVKVAATGRYVRGNNGRLSTDYTTIRDDSAKFFTRNMADGGYALVCKSSQNRITSTSTSAGTQLTSAAYSSNDQSQHWVLEPTETYTAEHPSYYLRNLATGVYAADVSGYLVAGTEQNRAELLLEPLDSESLLVQVSKTDAYARLSTTQRKRLEEVYGSLAGDLFGRYGGTAEYTPRQRMDAVFSDCVNGVTDTEASVTAMANLLNSNNNHIYSDSTLGRAVSASLPTAAGVTMTRSEGVYSERKDGAGGYFFWNSTYLSGYKYTLSIYDAEGELQQTITLYVHDDATAKANADVFCQVITQIPYQVRKYIRNVRVRNDSANSFNCGTSDLYIRLNWKTNAASVRSTVVHELGHSIDMSNGSWSQGAGWGDAMAADGFTVSTYARTTLYEDFAEFHRLYFMCYGDQDWQKGLQVLFPNRYASLYRLRNRHLAGFALWEDTETLDY